MVAIIIAQGRRGIHSSNQQRLGFFCLFYFQRGIFLLLKKLTYSKSVWMYHSLFIHLHDEGHLSCYLLVIMNNAVINICIFV